MGDFTKLAVWRKAHELARSIYEETSRWPKHELFGLTSQMRRASVSIGSNIAEGLGRRSDGELARFIQIAIGSCNELEYQIRLARDLGYISMDGYTELDRSINEVGRMLTGFAARVSERILRAKKQAKLSSFAPST